MRKLAKELGVEAMSLYNHVANKDDLLDGMIDIVFSEIDAPAAGGDWKAELRKRAVSTREALNRHRWAIGEMEGRTTHGPNNLRFHNAVLGCLRARRLLDRDDRPRHVGPGRLHLRIRPSAERHVLARRRRTSRPRRSGRCVDYAAALADYPHLVEVVGGYVAKAGYDYDSRVPLRPRRDPRPPRAAARRAVMERRASCLNRLELRSGDAPGSLASMRG